MSVNISVLDEILTTLRRKMPIYTNKITDNYKIINIEKIIVDANIIDFIITTDIDILLRTSEIDYRRLEVGDGICISKVKYQFALSKIKKDNTSLYNYRNQTTITANNILKFYNGTDIEISNVITDIAYNGIHNFIKINDEAVISAVDKIFKININPAITITTNEINNEGYYNLMFWNSKDIYGSLNDYHRITEIINDEEDKDKAFKFKIRIQRDNTINKYFFENDYDNLDISLAYVNANPRITNMATEEKGLNFAKTDFAKTDNNNWIIITTKEITHSNNGISTEDNSIYYNRGYRLTRNYIVNVRLYSNIGSEDISNNEFNNLAEEIDTSLVAAIYNQQISTSFLENNYVSYLIIPLEFSDNIQEEKTLIYKDFPFKITTMINEEDLQPVEEFQVPLMEFNLKYYIEGIDEENFEIQANQ